MSNDANLSPLPAPFIGLNLNARTRIVESTPGQTSAIDGNVIDVQSELVLACLAIVKERHKGHITIADATLQLVDLLPNDVTSNEAYGSYLDHLVEIDGEHLSATTRGRVMDEVLAWESNQQLTRDHF